MTTSTFEKTIRYDRKSRDYEMRLDGELIGYARTHHEAEVTLDQVAFDRLTHGDCATAEQMDGGCDDEPAEDEAVNWGSAPAAIAADDVPTDNPDIDSTPGTYGPEQAAFPTCRACQTRDFPPSALLADTCVACANARYFGLPNRLAAAQFAQTRQSQAIEAKIAICGYCAGIHHIQSCPELRGHVRASDADWRIAVGRKLCAMRWRDFGAFVALLLDTPVEQLPVYAESYIAFMRSNNERSDLTTHDVLTVWARLMSGGRGPTAPALLQRVA